MGTLLKISELTGASIAQLEFGYDYGFDDEVGEDPVDYRRDIDRMITELEGSELRLLRQLIPYLRAQPPQADA